MNATTPAVNVKESATDYTMELAAPGLKKDMVKMYIDKDGQVYALTTKSFYRGAG